MPPLPIVALLVCLAPLLVWAALHFLIRPAPSGQAYVVDHRGAGGQAYVVGDRGAGGQAYVVGHRGAGGLAPENTLAAIREGLRWNAEMVEIDIQRTADGTLIALHDETLDRTTNGRGPAAAMDWSAVRALDAGHGTGEPVPSLEEVLRLLGPEHAALMIEVKNPERYPGLETQLGETLHRSGLGGRALVGSFDHAWLRKFHAAAPEVGLILIAEGTAGLPEIPGARIAAVHWRSVAADPFSVRRIRRRGMRVQVWTVDSPGLMRWMLWLGVDGITTNRPDRARTVLRDPRSPG